MNELALYSSSSIPKQVTLKIGKWYMTTDGTKVLVYGIRTNGNTAQVYYKYPYGGKRWYSAKRWSMCNCTINDFMAKLIDLGQIDNVLLRPSK